MTRTQDPARRPDGAPPGELVSALADGELRGDEIDAALQLALSEVEAPLAGSPAAARWHDYHLIGEVLRSGAGACRPADGAMQARRGAGSPDAVFLARLRADRLASMALSSAPSAASEPFAPLASPAAGQARPPAANDPVFRWKLVAGFASVVAVVAVGTLTWSLAVRPAPTLPSAQMAAAPVPVVAPAAAPAVAPTGTPKVAPTGAPAASVPPAVVAAGVMLRDPQLDAFLQAHRDAGGPSALQMPAGFLRNATFEGPAR